MNFVSAFRDDAVLAGPNTITVRYFSTISVETASFYLLYV